MFTEPSKQSNWCISSLKHLAQRSGNCCPKTVLKMQQSKPKWSAGTGLSWQSCKEIIICAWVSSRSWGVVALSYSKWKDPKWKCFKRHLSSSSSDAAAFITPFAQSRKKNTARNGNNVDQDSLTLASFLCSMIICHQPHFCIGGISWCSAPTGWRLIRSGTHCTAFIEWNFWLHLLLWPIPPQMPFPFLFTNRVAPKNVYTFQHLKICIKIIIKFI